MTKIKVLSADPKINAETIEDYLGKEILLFFQHKLTKKQADSLQEKYGEQCKDISDGVALISKAIERKKQCWGIIRWTIYNIFLDCDKLVHRVNNPNALEYIGYEAYAELHRNRNSNRNRSLG